MVGGEKYREEEPQGDWGQEDASGNGKEKDCKPLRTGLRKRTGVKGYL